MLPLNLGLSRSEKCTRRTGARIGDGFFSVAWSPLCASLGLYSRILSKLEQERMNLYFTWLSIKRRGGECDSRNAIWWRIEAVCRVYFCIFSLWRYCQLVLIFQRIFDSLRIGGIQRRISSFFFLMYVQIQKNFDRDDEINYVDSIKSRRLLVTSECCWLPCWFSLHVVAVSFLNIISDQEVQVAEYIIVVVDR